MKKTILLSIFLSVFVLGMHAQVKIKDGTITPSVDEPISSAILEVESNNKGLLMPRLALSSTGDLLNATVMSELTGMTVYNTTPAGTGDTAVTPGVYYNNGTVWVRVAGGNDVPNDVPWFYMPSIDVPTSYDPTITNDEKKTVYLYEEYIRQFKTTAANGTAGLPESNIVSSAPLDSKYTDVLTALSIATPPAATDFVYFIIDYDTNLFDDVEVDANGKLTYTIIAGATATEQSYMNIVFVKK